MYRVWPDNESHESVYRDFDNLDEACEFASTFVHQYDYKNYRVILHIDDDDTDETIDTYENINPCDIDFEAH